MGLKFEFESIATIRSPFKDKYGVPRQPGLTQHALGQIIFKNDPDLRTALKTLEQFSHLWVLFVFHQHGGKKWKPSIRPPRLGGRTKVGVLASRSPHRPNPIGMSVLEIRNIDFDYVEGPMIEVAGLDIIDGTPVLDIKPYIPYADSIEAAKAGWAQPVVERVTVMMSESVALFFAESQRENLKELVVEVLELDPRPAYLQREKPANDPQFWEHGYGIEIANHEVKYHFNKQGLFIDSIEAVPPLVSKTPNSL